MTAYCEKMDQLSDEFYGSHVPATADEINTYWVGLNAINPGVQGVTRQDIDRSDEIFAALGADMMGGAQ